MLVNGATFSYGTPAEQGHREPTYLEPGRGVPSGGAKYPMETYLLLWRGAAGLDAGVYHLDPHRARLRRTCSVTASSERGSATAGDASFSIVLSSRVWRNTAKYASVGLVLAAIEVGVARLEITCGATSLDWTDASPLDAWGEVLSLQPELERVVAVGHSKAAGQPTPQDVCASTVASGADLEGDREFAAAAGDEAKADVAWLFEPASARDRLSQAERPVRARTGVPSAPHMSPPRLVSPPSMDATDAVIAEALSAGSPSHSMLDSDVLTPVRIRTISACTLHYDVWDRARGTFSPMGERQFGEHEVLTSLMRGELLWASGYALWWVAKRHCFSRLGSASLWRVLQHSGWEAQAVARRLREDGLASRLFLGFPREFESQQMSDAAAQPLLQLSVGSPALSPAATRLAFSS